MNSIKAKCIFNMMVLTKYLKTNFGEHLPFEIVQIIIMIYSKLINMSISCGHRHTMLINQSELYGWGLNDDGQLGLGMSKYDHPNLPKKINLNNVVFVSCGACHTMAVTILGELYAWGSNLLGQLGLGARDNIYRNIPHKVNLCNVIEVNCGDFHTMAITTSNELYAWGSTYNGKLGLGELVLGNDIRNYRIPQKVDLPNVMAVSCGADHTVAITIGRELHAWGSNTYGQLGLDDYNRQLLPKKINLQNVISVSCGDYHTMAITSDNELYVWGSNCRGQVDSRNDGQFLLQKVDLHNVGIFGYYPTVIRCGMYHSMATTTDRKLYAWGDNTNGQLGTSEPKKVTLDDVIAVGCGSYHTVAITTSNEIYAWGSNNMGQLGLGDNLDRNIPHKINFKF